MSSGWDKQAVSWLCAYASQDRTRARKDTPAGSVMVGAVGVGAVTVGAEGVRVQGVRGFRLEGGSVLFVDPAWCGIGVV